MTVDILIKTRQSLKIYDAEFQIFHYKTNSMEKIYV